MRRSNFLLYVSLQILMGCSASSGGSGSDAVSLPQYDRLKLLTSFSDEVVTPSIQTFKAEMSQLHTEVNSFCTGLTAGQTWSEKVGPAQEQWKKAMASWQEIEAFQFGPLTERAGSLRYSIYTWPVIDACGVDRQVGLMSKDSGYILPNSVGIKGLSAMEYLLFDADSLHACNDASAETQAWNQLPEAERQDLRCRYLKLLSSDLGTNAELLAEKWNGADPNFRSTLLAPGSDSELQKRVNSISDSLFFIDSTVKDAKLGTPLGLYTTCKKTTCPDSIEHEYSRQGLVAIQHNLVGFQAAFTRGSPVSSSMGFDDALKEVGAESLASRMNENLQSAIDSMAALAQNQDYLTLVLGLDKAACEATTATDRQVEICALHKDIKRITDDYKREFTEVLKLTLPAQSAGDND